LLLALYLSDLEKNLFIDARFQVFTVVLLRIQVFFLGCLPLKMNAVCSLETLETTYPMTRHILRSESSFIDVFLASDWSEIYGDLSFWHIHKETLQKHAHQHCHIFLSIYSNLKTTLWSLMKFDIEEFY
jgi:hypothetical protein